MKYENYVEIPRNGKAYKEVCDNISVAFLDHSSRTA